MRFYLSISFISFFLLFLSTLLSDGAEARNYISIVGSSTVFPYTQAVSEEFADKADFPSPVVESTGTGGGFKAFCGGIGLEYADITGASRPIKDKEQKNCRENDVTDITELKIGSDGIVIASSINGIEMGLSLESIYLAFAYEIPTRAGRAVNDLNTWQEVGEALSELGLSGHEDYPDIRIRAFGPPPTSGTRDAFVELAMIQGCKRIAQNVSVVKEDLKDVCGRIRNDGAYIDSGENDNLIIQRLVADKDAVGIFGYSFLYENVDKIKAIKVEGVLPSLETIGDERYPISRPLFIYVKEQHRLLVPGINEFLKEYFSEDAFSEDGYLQDRGLILPSEKNIVDLQDRAIKH